MRFEPKAFEPHNRDGACTCTGDPREAHDPECPVRKAHPRLDLGDEPLEHTPLSTRLDALRQRLGRAGAARMAAGGTGSTRDASAGEGELRGIVEELTRVVEALEKRTAPPAP